MDENLDAARVWMEIEEHLVPYLRLKPVERCIYSHLFRHSRLRGQRALLISQCSLGRALGIHNQTIRTRLHSLARKGCLKILERGVHGTLVEVLTPAEIPGCIPSEPLEQRINLEAADCFRIPDLRAAILRRDRNRCFYCLRELNTGTEVLDHVVPQAQGGDNSYRNVVACCYACNMAKVARPAADFLRWLYRHGRLTGSELESRLAALEQLPAAAGGTLPAATPSKLDPPECTTPG